MSDFYTIGIETSCDDSCVAILKNERDLIVNLISSQIDIHTLFGGVVPEIASRKHLEAINPLIEKALADANLRYSDIDLISVTKGPGLMGSLLVGISAAKALSLAANKPMIGANHMEGHICANYLANKDLKPPFVTLVVSGGHTYLVKVKSYTDYEVVGKTRDDAAGESYDKVARKMGLGYPGGPKIDKLAKEGDPKAVDFPRVMLEKDSYDFSFSGLKTAVINYMHQLEQKNIDYNKADVAASFQDAVVDVLVAKSMRLIKESGYDKLALSGGVAANSRLRGRLEEACRENNIKFYYPPIELCTDNAAMIAMTGYLHYQSGEVSDKFMKVYPNLEIWFMRRKKRYDDNSLKKYNSMKKISTILWILTGLGVLGFGIYFKEIFEIIFGIAGVIYGIYNHRTKITSLTSISRIEKNKLSFLALCIVVYSLVNPLANIAVIYDLFKRDYVINGGFDEKTL